MIKWPKNRVFHRVHRVSASHLSRWGKKETGRGRKKLRAENDKDEKEEKPVKHQKPSVPDRGASWLRKGRERLSTCPSSEVTARPLCFRYRFEGMRPTNGNKSRPCLASLFWAGGRGVCLRTPQPATEHESHRSAETSSSMQNRRFPEIHLWITKLNSPPA